MTRDEIMDMQAGAEMDALISSKIFEVMAFRATGNWEHENESDYLDEGEAYYFGEYQETIRLPKYSTDIAAAWEIVEKLKAAGKWLSISTSFIGTDEKWCCEYSENNIQSEVDFVLAETAPLAICRAALLPVSNG